VEKRHGLEYRAFGKTGEKVAMLGLGGYHFLEIPQAEVTAIVQRYLELGGNYVETAYAYGSGASERKIGEALQGRRSEVFLVTKTTARDKEGAARMLERSLTNLKTDHVDLLFMHAVQESYELKAILSEKGALRAAEEARQAGKVRFIGISGHGWADVLIEALNRYPFDAVMHTFNYLDRFNYPSSEKELLPLAAQKGVAVVGMKPVGDGYLYRSPEPAFRYAFTLPCATIVSGMNKLEYLEGAMAAAKSFQPMSEKEMEKLFAEAPELGDYVCRQCYKCMPNSQQVPIPQIFQLEGMFDRQMEDGRQHEAEDQLLRSRLSGWFGTDQVARQRYRDLKVNPDDFDACAEVEPKCPYGIGIVRKLKITHVKLG
jgi:predicted aldo/keto reductase-like oxidoreductase